MESYFEYYFNYMKEIDVRGKNILHLGSGWDKRSLNSLIKKARIFSIDIDFKAIQKNGGKFRVNGNGEIMPFLKNAFDYVISEDFLEHVRSPERLLDELNRVLTKRGEIVFTTPGGWSYIAIISRITPLGFHKWINKLRGVDTDDIYPTYYRFNSIFSIKSKGKRFGFSVKMFKMITGEPSYFSFSKILRSLFLVYHKFLAKIDILNKFFGINIFCVLKKK